MKAFTLAEVLIALVIIGVIAAITVPSLMNNTNTQEYRSALKKAISAANQALELHYALEGLGAQDYDNETDLINNLFAKRMNVIDVDYSTFPNNYEISLCVPTPFNSFITQDGMIFCVQEFHNSGSVLGSERCDANNEIPCAVKFEQYMPNLYIDVNGLKKPNKPTERSSRPLDQYYALIYNTKVEPFGAAIDIMSGSNNINVGIPSYPDDEPEGPPPVL